MKIRLIIGLVTVLLFLATIVSRAQHSTAIDSFNYYYSEKDYARALEYWEYFKNDSICFDLVFKAGNCYLYLAKYDIALDYYDITRSYIDKNDTANTISLLINFGHSYKNLNELDSAWQYYQKAKILNDKFKSIHDARLKLSLAKFYNKVNDIDSSEKYILLALDSYLKQYGELSERALYIYVNLVEFFSETSAANKAIFYGRKGLEVYDQLNIDKPWWLFSIYYNLGSVYYSIKDWPNTIYFFNLALSAITQNNISYKTSIESILTYCYSMNGELSPDTTFFFNQIEGAPLDTIAYSYHLIFFGKQLANQKHDYHGARSCYNQAFILLENKHGIYHDAMKDIYQILGTSALNRQVYDSALYYLQRSLYCRSVEVDTSDYESNPPLHRQADHWLLDLVKRKIRVLTKIAQQSLGVDSAIRINHIIVANCNDYIQLLEKLLRNKTFLADKMNVLRENIRRNMLTGINACYELYSLTQDVYFLEKGLGFSEAGKYLLLKSMMDEKAQKQVLPEEIINTEILLTNQLNTLHQQLNRHKEKAIGDNKKLEDSLNKQLFSLILQKDSLRNIILTMYPGVQQHETFHLSLNDIRSQLTSEQVLIEYFLQDSVLHAFYISSSGMTWKRTETAGELHSAIGHIRRFCSLEEYGKVSKSQYIRDAVSLSNALLSSADLLNPGVKQYLIVPDGEITYLPFDILLRSNVDENTSYRNLPYLFRNRTFAYYHSVQFIFENQTNLSGMGTGVLALAPKFKGNSIEPSRENINTLKGAAQEAKQIIDIMGGELLAGNDATKESFFKNAPGKSILHFASHAALDPNNAFDSHILMSGGAEASEPKRLYTLEICCMNLDAQMAVLSSCYSGGGQLFAGEGVISLAWAFRYAGCGSVVMSLFQLDDRSTRNIMTSFYAYLKDGKSKNNALRQAKLDYLDEIVPARTHPRFWAGLAVTGDQKALEMDEPFFIQRVRTALIIMIFMIVLLLTITRIVRKR